MAIGSFVGIMVQKYYIREESFGNLIVLLVALTHSTTIPSSLTESLNHLLVDLTERSHYQSELSTVERLQFLPDVSSELMVCY